MLIWRLLLGAVFIGGVGGLCWADYYATTPGSWLFFLALPLSVAASGELIGMLRGRGWAPAAWPIYLGNIAIVVANFIPTLAGPKAIGPFEAPAIAFAFSVILVFVVEMVRYREPGHSTLQLATAILVLAYVSWLFTFLIELRVVGDRYSGMAALVSLVIVVKMCDIGAYTGGRLFGRHKMAPRLSGGKTMEGLVGGLVFACIGSYCSFHYVMPGMLTVQRPLPSSYAWVVYGFGVGIAGVLGDLGESLLKRDLGCKDSSTWMPGFGGVLDVIDSLLFAAPIGYALWSWLVL
jgi:phosphatidate cytidylyltransferase